jgi:hypothetical protein
MSSTTEKDICQMVAGIIREHSQKVELVSAEQLEDELKKRVLGTRGEDEVSGSMEMLLERALEKHDDLNVVHEPNGAPLYYSRAYLSESYAKIVVRKSSPLSLIAETVRENAALYPRPVPLDMFEDSPFDLRPEDIQTALRALAKDDHFQDIRFTKTSMGTVYLYSTRHMDHGYATMLAERDDVDLIFDP